MVQTLTTFPRQAIWQMIALPKAAPPNELRASRFGSILKAIKKAESKARSSSDHENYKLVNNIIAASLSLNDALLKMCNQKLPDNEPITVPRHFPDLLKVLASVVIIPLQSSMTASVPSSASEMADHQPFPTNLPGWKGA